MMTHTIKEAFTRSKKALSLRPSLGYGSASSKVTVLDGLTVKMEEGDWSFIADMPKQVGGRKKGPTPGVYGRAALGSCLAISLSMYANYKEIPINKLSVEVQTDYDDGALFGIGDAPPGYLEVRYIISVESEAPEVIIQELIEEAERHTPYLDVFSRAQMCKKILNYSQPND